MKKGLSEKQSKMYGEVFPKHEQLFFPNEVRFNYTVAMTCVAGLLMFYDVNPHIRCLQGFSISSLVPGYNNGENSSLLKLNVKS